MSSVLLFVPSLYQCLSALRSQNNLLSFLFSFLLLLLLHPDSLLVSHLIPPESVLVEAGKAGECEEYHHQSDWALFLPVDHNWYGQRECEHSQDSAESSKYFPQKSLKHNFCYCKCCNFFSTYIWIDVVTDWGRQSELTELGQ